MQLVAPLAKVVDGCAHDLKWKQRRRVVAIACADNSDAPAGVAPRVAGAGTRRDFTVQDAGPMAAQPAWRRGARPGSSVATLAALRADSAENFSCNCGVHHGMLTRPLLGNVGLPRHMEWLFKG